MFNWSIEPHLFWLVTSCFYQLWQFGTLCRAITTRCKSGIYLVDRVVPWDLLLNLFNPVLPFSDHPDSWGIKEPFKCSEQSQFSGNGRCLFPFLWGEEEDVLRIREQRKSGGIDRSLRCQVKLTVYSEEISAERNWRKGKGCQFRQASISKAQPQERRSEFRISTANQCLCGSGK